MLSLMGGIAPPTVPITHRFGGFTLTNTGLNYKIGLLLGPNLILVHCGTGTGAFLLCVSQRAFECHNPHLVHGCGLRRGGRLSAGRRESSFIRSKGLLGLTNYNRFLATGLLQLGPERMGSGRFRVDFGAKLIDYSVELLIRFDTDARLEISALSMSMTG